MSNQHAKPTEANGSQPFAGVPGSTLSFEEVWRDPAPSPAPRTDAAFAKYIHDASPIPFRDFARQLEIENGDLRKRVALAEAAVVAAHSAMLGKVNPKHPAWGCIYAVQDAANRANYEPMSRHGGVVHESNK